MSFYNWLWNKNIGKPTQKVEAKALVDVDGVELIHYGKQPTLIMHRHNIDAACCACEIIYLRDQLKNLSDNQEFDATDAAHPAWWRGHDHTTMVFCDLVNKILDGKDDGQGSNYQPWADLRQRLLSLMTEQRTLQSQFKEHEFTLPDEQGYCSICHKPLDFLAHRPIILKVILGEMLTRLLDLEDQLAAEWVREGVVGTMAEALVLIRSRNKS